MAKVASYATKAFVFFQSAQGKRDVALAIAAVGGAIDAYHRIFG